MISNMWSCCCWVQFSVAQHLSSLLLLIACQLWEPQELTAGKQSSGHGVVIFATKLMGCSEKKNSDSGDILSALICPGFFSEATGPQDSMMLCSRQQGTYAYHIESVGNKLYPALFLSHIFLQALINSYHHDVFYSETIFSSQFNFLDLFCQDIMQLLRWQLQPSKMKPFLPCSDFSLPYCLMK